MLAVYVILGVLITFFTVALIVDKVRERRDRSAAGGRPFAILIMAGTLSVAGCGCASNPVNPALANANQKAVQSIVADNEALVVKAGLGEAEASSHKERNQAALEAAQRLVEEANRK